MPEQNSKNYTRKFNLEETLGTALSIIFYYKGNKKKEFSYCIITHTLITDRITKIQNLNIKYHELPVDNLSFSKIMLWNSGNITIDKGDITEKSKVLITVNENIVVYDIYIIGVVDEVNNIKLTKEEINKYSLNFDYLDNNDGCIVQIMHSSKEEYHFTKKDKNINVSGKLKGAGLPKYQNDFAPFGNAGKKSFGSKWLANHWNIIDAFSLPIFVIFVWGIAYGIGERTSRTNLFMTLMLLLSLIVPIKELRKVKMPTRLGKIFLPGRFN